MKDLQGEYKVQALKGFQKKYLRGLVHDKKPIVHIGQKGTTPTLTKAVDEALGTHELIKVKFIDFKEKVKKIALSDRIAKDTSSHVVGMIGHIAIFFRQHKNPEKRKITIPQQ